MSEYFKFNRMELSGSLGDLGTILPLSIGMILINDLNPMGVFMGVGLFYIFSGLYFRVTCPVEPMKVISAYAIASGLTASQIQSSALWLFLILFFIGSTGLVKVIGRFIPKTVVRGVQLSTGALLVNHGIRLMLGTSPFQILAKVSEPHLILQYIGPLPFGIVVGTLLGFLTLFLLENKKFPAAVVIVGIGLLLGIVFGKHEGVSEIKVGLYFPNLLPYGLPTMIDLNFALLILVLPQIPMTIGNAVMANADLSAHYFPEHGKRVTYRALCIGMALANLGSFFIGGIPMCQGAGGLASRYRFGARTAGSNLIIGSIFFFLVFILGPHILTVLNLLPLSVLGVLLIFAGIQLALTILDLKTRKDLFVPILIMGITLASNLAAGFLFGIIVAHLLRWDRLKI